MNSVANHAGRRRRYRGPKTFDDRPCPRDSEGVLARLYAFEGSRSTVDQATALRALAGVVVVLLAAAQSCRIWPTVPEGDAQVPVGSAEGSRHSPEGAACTATEDCGPGLVCSFGLCVVGCDETHPECLPSAPICESHRCIQCREDGDCGEAAACRAHRCIDRALCADHELPAVYHDFQDWTVRSDQVESLAACGVIRFRSS
jgi:hypothetical protein